MLLLLTARDASTRRSGPKSILSALANADPIFFAGYRCVFITVNIFLAGDRTVCLMFIFTIPGILPLSIFVVVGYEFYGLGTFLVYGNVGISTALVGMIFLVHMHRHPIIFLEIYRLSAILVVDRQCARLRCCRHYNSNRQYRNKYTSDQFYTFVHIQSLVH